MPPENDPQIPQPVGGGVVPPVNLGTRLEDLGHRLDEMFSVNGRAGERPSEWLAGAVFASQNTLRGNADWIAQASHSLREILYRLCSPRMGAGEGAARTREFLATYGSAQDVEKSVVEVTALHKKLCDICHHLIRIEDTEEGTFENLLSTFDRVMSAALERQLEVHAEIETLELPPNV